MDLAKDSLRGDWTMHYVVMYDGMLGTPCLKCAFIDIHFSGHSMGLKYDFHCIHFLRHSSRVSYSPSYLNIHKHTFAPIGRLERQRLACRHGGV